MSDHLPPHPSPSVDARHRRRLRPTYANVVATLALVLALGTTAWAAPLIITGGNVRDSTLTGKDVKDETLTGRDVKLGSITGLDVRNESLTTGDVKNGSLTGVDFAPGTRLTGPAGAKGAKGDPGEPTFTSTVVVQSGTDREVNGDRLRAALAKAATIVALRDSDEQVLVQLEPGDFRVDSTLVLPDRVSMAGAVGQASEIKAVPGAFTGTALLRIEDTVTNDGDRFLRDLAFIADGWTGMSGDVAIVDLGSNDIEASNIEVSGAVPAGATAFRGIVQPGSGNRLELSDSRISISSTGGTANVDGIADTSAGSFFTLVDVRSEVSSDGASSAALDMGSGTAQVSGGSYSSSSSAISLATAAGGQIVANGSTIDGANAAIAASGAGSHIVLVGGLLLHPSPPTQASGGDVTCLGVAESILDAATFATQSTCA